MPMRFLIHAFFYCSKYLGKPAMGPTLVISGRFADHQEPPTPVCEHSVGVLIDSGESRFGGTLTSRYQKEQKIPIAYYYVNTSKCPVCNYQVTGWKSWRVLLRSRSPLKASQGVRCV